MEDYTSLKIVRKLEFAWVYIPNGLLTGFGISKGYFSFDESSMKLQIVEDGRSKRPQVHLDNIIFEDEYLSEAPITFANFYDLQNTLASKGCPLSVNSVSVNIGEVNAINIRAVYNGISVTVPNNMTISRIVSLNDPNTAFTGVVTGTSLVITGGVTGDVYLIDGLNTI